MPSQLSCLNCWTFNVHLNPVHIQEEEEEEEETTRSIVPGYGLQQKGGWRPLAAPASLVLEKLGIVNAILMLNCMHCYRNLSFIVRLTLTGPAKAAIESCVSRDLIMQGQTQNIQQVAQVVNSVIRRYDDIIVENCVSPSRNSSA